jgi:penicillin-binding protein 1A
VARRRSKGRRSALSPLLTVAAVVAGLGALGAGAIALTLWVYASDPALPRMSSARDYRPPAVSRVTDRGGRVLGEIYRERRTVVPLSRIPPVLLQAVLAAEDADFYHHRGLDWAGMVRAFFANLRAGRFVQGGSTITQQVVKTFFLGPERTLRRKIQEVILARRLERELDKNEILFLYLNQIYFGHGRWGVEEAARFYFGHGVEHVDLPEAAMLAGLPQAPELLSPLRHPDRAGHRRRYVLDQMVRRGMITADQATRAAEARLPARPRDEPFLGTAPEMVDWVRVELARRYGQDGLDRLGAEVRTTLDVSMQRTARAALEDGLRAVDLRQGFARPLRRVTGAALTKHLATQRAHANGAIEGVVVQVNDAARAVQFDLGSRRATLDLGSDGRVLGGHARPSEVFRAGDVWRLRADPAGDALMLDQLPQGALVALDPASGEVRALVGGYGFGAGGFDRALQSHRQPGSAFKPVVYAAAIDSRRFTAATVLDDAPEVFGSWTPKNYDGAPFRGPIRLRVALYDSVNTVAVRLLDQLGPPAAIAMARRLGIASPLEANLSLALGTSSLTPLELASAFSVFAARGMRAAPRFLLAVGGRAEPAPVPERVLAADTAFVMTTLLRSVVLEGTGRAARDVGRPAAGKTGTSDDHRDAWFIGYTPELCAAVWVGFDEPRPLQGPLGKGEAGGHAAAPIWAAFVKKALSGQAGRDFEQPPGVVVARIDPRTGLRAADGALDAVDEYFLSGTEPAEAAPAAGEVDPGSFLLEQ